MTRVLSLSLILQVALMLVFINPLSADMPQIMNVQGLLTDANGEPVSDGIHSVVFSIYNSETGGSALWTEARSVSTADGLFSLVLGEIEPIPGTLFTEHLWLGIAVAGDAELAPRQQMTAVPYAYRALNTDSADIAFNVADDAIGSDQIVDGSILLADLNQNGAGTNQIIKWNGSAWVAANDEIGGAGTSGWTEEGSVVHLTTTNNEVGIGTSDTDEKLHVENSNASGRSFLQLETSNASNWGECGLRFVTPDNRWHLRMDDYSNNNLPVVGSLGLRSQNSSKEVMTWTNDGDVGIGDTSPDAKLDVAGDLEVTGAYRGTISSSSNSDGAPFPRPAYDSGWLTISNNSVLTLAHNIGGDVDDYVVCLQFKDNTIGINNFGMGGDDSYTGGSEYQMGAYYSHLTTTSIKVSRRMADEYADRIRVRIWVIN
jgi:hypothetical protein